MPHVISRKTFLRLITQAILIDEDYIVVDDREENEQVDITGLMEWLQQKRAQDTQMRYTLNERNETVEKSGEVS